MTGGCVATIPVGYADGYPRPSGRGSVPDPRPEARILPTCMDQFMVMTGIAVRRRRRDTDRKDGDGFISVENWPGRRRFAYEIICSTGNGCPGYIYGTHGRVIGKKIIFSDIYEGFGYM